MPNKILPLLVLPMVCGWILPCEARNNPSSRPSEQRQDGVFFNVSLFAF